MTRTVRRMALVFGCALAAGCAVTPETEPAPSPIRSTALGLKLVELDQRFGPAVETAGELRLAAPLDGVEAEIVLRVERRTSPVNLVDEAKSFGARFAAQPGGVFHGGNELVTPFGPAFTVRGSRARDGAPLAGGEEPARLEERQVLMLHPNGSGELLILALGYPAADAGVARARLAQLLEVVAALEPLAG